MYPDGPAGGPLPDPGKEERKQQRRDAVADGGGDAGDIGEAASSSGCGDSGGGCGDSGGGCGDSGGGCDGCDCNFGLLMRLSTVLLLVAAIVPDVGGGPVVRALLHLYRRRLTRFTRACPSTPSCSAYALAAVESLGPRRGLVAAAHRIRRCAPPSGSIR